MGKCSILSEVDQANIEVSSEKSRESRQLSVSLPTHRDPHSRQMPGSSMTILNDCGGPLWIRLSPAGSGCSIMESVRPSGRRSAARRPAYDRAATTVRQTVLSQPVSPRDAPE